MPIEPPPESPRARVRQFLSESAKETLTRTWPRWKLCPPRKIPGSPPLPEHLLWCGRFAGFSQALAALHTVAGLAEKANHHPVMTLSYRTLRLELTSFDVRGLTARDARLAEAIETALKTHPHDPC